MGTRIVVLRWGWIAAISAGCTTLAGIDEDYVAIGASGTAGTRSNVGAGGDFGGSAGVGGSGGAIAGAAGANGVGGAGASGASGGTNGNGGSGGTAACPQGQKRCRNECEVPSTANGCAPDTCEACPAPNIEHVEVWCNSEHDCDVRCSAGFVPDSGRCVPEGSVGSGGTGGTGGTGGSTGTTGSGGTMGGGSGGTGGTGGSTGTTGSGGTGGRCSPSTCPNCPLPDGKIPCCTLGGKCGCGYPVVGAFYCI